MNTETKDLKYIMYVRKSSEGDERQIQSIEDQIEVLTALSKRQILKVHKIIEERKSAKDPGNRPEFTKMIEMIESGQANAILCWKYDRLTRNALEDGKLKWMLQQGIIKIISTIDRDYKPDDNALLLSIEGGMANQYIRDLSRNVKRGMQSKREKGWFPHKAGKGYINKDGEIVPDTEGNRFGILRKVCELALTEKYSVAKLIDIANNNFGYKSRKTKRGGGKKLTKTGLYELFANPFYKSEYVLDGKTYKLKHKPMLTEEEWDRIQIILGRKNRPRRKSHEFAYRGPIICNECNCLITAEEKIKKIKSTGKSISYIYYHCTGRRGNCSQTKYIREDKLEQLIKDEISKFTILPQFRDWALEVLRESHKDEVNERKEIFKNLERTYKDIESQINKLTDMKLKDQLTDEEYNVKREQLLADKAKIKENIDSYDTRIDGWFELAEKGFNFIAGAREAFETGDLDTKKAILAAIGKKITLLNGKVIIEPEEWLVPIADKYPALEREYEMFEPAKSTDFTHKNEVLAPIRTAWLGREDSNL
ncbi:MAG: recombinase family protein [Candidatus Humimicrobiaceae bacterium]